MVEGGLARGPTPFKRELAARWTLLYLTPWTLHFSLILSLIPPSHLDLFTFKWTNSKYTVSVCWNSAADSTADFDVFTSSTQQIVKWRHRHSILLEKLVFGKRCGIQHLANMYSIQRVNSKPYFVSFCSIKPSRKESIKCWKPASHITTSIHAHCYRSQSALNSFLQLRSRSRSLGQRSHCCCGVFKAPTVAFSNQRLSPNTRNNIFNHDTFATSTVDTNNQIRLRYGETQILLAFSFQIRYHFFKGFF